MQVARTAHASLTSNVIRKIFLDFFCLEKGHRLVRSSPVLPYGDPSLAFVNAGMNQFKGVLLGTAVAPSGRVANSQKCVRVGGKHNDLAMVGRDTSHHTFFEMLGNWSFGDYFKSEACQMSWELLTKAYGIDPSLLYVTYFAGDPTMGLQPDLETRDVWRSIGIPEERLRPGSAKDNFWEMGDTGPCGGCTEIHYLPRGDDPAHMLELWNLVFIEYNREPDGSLSKLGRRHVDTGMGFERLVAVLQGKESNYDTDLFTPLFHAIHKITGCPEYQGCYGSKDISGLDTAYRLLSDHSRMTAVCLADGFFPDQEGKLRGIIRKALTVCRNVFHKEEDLLKEITSVVSDTLSEAYPEVGRNLSRVHHIISYEAELLRSLITDTANEWKTLCQKEPLLTQLPVQECPNLLPAYRKLKAVLPPNASDSLDPSLVWKICETFGVPPHLAEHLAIALDLELDLNALEVEITKSKLESRKEIYGRERIMCRGLSTSTLQKLAEAGVPHTDDSFKYLYRTGHEKTPTFPHQSAAIVALLINGHVVDHVTPEQLANPDNSVAVILDRTNMYSEAGGQASDRGVIFVEGEIELPVEDVSCSAGYVLHWLRSTILTHQGVDIHNYCEVKLDADRRRNLMNNHTATHLLNAALRQFLQLIEQKSSRVTSEKLSFDFSVYRETLTSEEIAKLEKTVCNVIRHGTFVRRKSYGSLELGSLNPLTVLPGETYPYRSVHVVEVSSGFFLSREPCCGTHALHTSHLKDFVITSFKSISSSVKTIQAVTGAEAAKARANAVVYREQLKSLSHRVNEVLKSENETEVEECDSSLGAFGASIRNMEFLSHLVKEELSGQVNQLRIKLKYSARGVLRTSMEEEMKDVIASNKLPYLVHYLECSSSLDNVPLQKASRLCANKPSLIFARSGGVIKARCCVPQMFVNEQFSAQLWLGSILRFLEAEGGPPRGQNPHLVYNMKGKKLIDVQLSEALIAAHKFAAENQ